MAHASLKSNNRSLDNGINLEEELLECLFKAEASAYIANSDEFLTFDKSISYRFLWILNDLMSEARAISEQLAYKKMIKGN